MAFSAANGRGLGRRLGARPWPFVKPSRSWRSATGSSPGAQRPLEPPFVDTRARSSELPAAGGSAALGKWRHRALRATSPINAVNRLADVRQTLTDALDSAASVIATAEADDLRVHRVRRDLKCAAALIPLFAPSVGRATKAARRMVRSVHQSLGSARDVAAMQMTLRRLDVSDASKAALAALIETRRRTTSRSPDDRLQQAESLRSLALEAKAWRVEGPENALALKTIESAYRTARRLGRKAFKRGHPEELHRLRRRVIALGHRLEVWSPADEARNRQFSR